MSKIVKRLKNEKGSYSIEFLGILPFLLFIFILLWQAVASGYAVYTLKTAANEGAKVYALTENIDEAESAVREGIDSTNVLTYQNMWVVPQGNGQFELYVSVQHPLIFVPDPWKPQTTFTLNESITSRVLVP